MAEEKTYKIVIASPAKSRYHQSILPYVYENFSFERAREVDENILRSVETLDKQPNRGRREKYLEEAKGDFRFILHRETKQFEIKIIYYIDEDTRSVYITDLFPTKMNPQKISVNNS